MNETKSICVTCLVLVLLGVAAFAFYRLCMPAFIVMAAIFAAVGVLTAAFAFCLWLEDTGCAPEEAAPPADITAVEEALRDLDFSKIEEEARAET